MLSTFLSAVLSFSLVAESQPGPPQFPDLPKITQTTKDARLTSIGCLGLKCLPVVPEVAAMPTWIILPVQPQALQSVLQFPQAISVQSYVPVKTLRWGFFHRRLVPGTTYIPTQPQLYVPWVPQPAPQQQP